MNNTTKTNAADTRIDNNTSGPWTWSDEAGGNLLVAGESCKCSHVISMRTDSHGFHYLSISNADRRLISAAPELLAVAKALIDWHRTDVNGSFGTELFPVTSAAYLAIAKAECK